MLNLTIINRSLWPDWFLEPVCKWIAGRAQIDRRYSITFRATNRPHYYRGTGWTTACTVTYHRRATRAKVKDHRFSWGPSYQIKPGIEMLVYLIAHEMYHSTGGNPARYQMPNGRTNADLMEHRCNEFGYKTLAEFRTEWPAFRALILARLRRERLKAKAREVRQAEVRQLAARPEAKIEARALRLKVWERKLKLAQTKVRKLRRSIQAIERRAAMGAK